MLKLIISTITPKQFDPRPCTFYWWTSNEFIFSPFKMTHSVDRIQSPSRRRPLWYALAIPTTSRNGGCD